MTACESDQASAGSSRRLAEPQTVILCLTTSFMASIPTRACSSEDRYPADFRRTIFDRRGEGDFSSVATLTLHTPVRWCGRRNRQVRRLRRAAPAVHPRPRGISARRWKSILAFCCRAVGGADCYRKTVDSGQFNKTLCLLRIGQKSAFSINAHIIFHAARASGSASTLQSRAWQNPRPISPAGRSLQTGKWLPSIMALRTPAFTLR